MTTPNVPCPAPEFADLFLEEDGGRWALVERYPAKDTCLRLAKELQTELGVGRRGQKRDNVGKFCNFNPRLDTHKSWCDKLVVQLASEAPSHFPYRHDVADGSTPVPSTRSTTPLTPNDNADDAAIAITEATEKLGDLRAVAVAEPLTGAAAVKIERVLSDFDKERQLLQAVVAGSDRPWYGGPTDAPAAPSTVAGARLEFGTRPVTSAAGAAEQIYAQYSVDFHRIIGDTGYPKDLAVDAIRTILESDVGPVHGDLRWALFGDCELMCAWEGTHVRNQLWRLVRETAPALNAHWGSFIRDVVQDGPDSG